VPEEEFRKEISTIPTVSQGHTKKRGMKHREGEVIGGWVFQASLEKSLSNRCRYKFLEKALVRVGDLVGGARTFTGVGDWKKLCEEAIVGEPQKKQSQITRSTIHPRSEGEARKDSQS